MLFNTPEFALFFVLVCGLYVVLGHTGQNRMLLVASYIFYGWWDVRYLSLLLLSTVIDYICGLKIYEATRPEAKKWYVTISVVSNLLILGFFKYFNFFAANAHALLQRMGVLVDPLTLNIVLPVGISFYTFQAMSYTIDVYRGDIKPAKTLRDFALYVSVFPQLVAGPIERAQHLLPQVLAPRRVTLAQLAEGGYLILWGLFQKVYIADNLAWIVDSVFNSGSPQSGMATLLGMYAFAFQILCDFEGYSNMARGIGLCLGFDIMWNFNVPYAATNPVDFWRRWHISLSTWLRDYLYIPLGGNRQGRWPALRNVMITMLLGGLWHGASWTFVLWGVYHGALIVIYRLLQPLLARLPALPPGIAHRVGFLLRVAFFFHLICLGWLLFRAQSLSQAWAMVHALCWDLRLADAIALGALWWKFLAAIAILLVVQGYQYARKNLLVVFEWPFMIRWGFYTMLFHLLTAVGAPGGRQFIYFQF